MSDTLAPALLRGSFWSSSIFSALGRKAVKPVAAGQLEGLVQRLQSGDDSALEGFIEATYPMAYRLAFSIVGERERSRDVLQEVYLTVYQKIGQLRDPQALRGWFSQILVNRARQELRGKRMESLDDVPERGDDQMSSRVDLQVDVRAAMGQLPAIDQTVLTMREVLELSYQEIADCLKLPLGTVRSRLFNARQRLLGLLGPERSHR